MLLPFGQSDCWDHLKVFSPPLQVRPGKTVPPVFEGRNGQRVRLALKGHERLYKFSEPKWVDRFFECGEIRIGTLFEYHGMKADAQVRQDDREGIHEYLDHKGGLLVTPALNQWLFCTSTSNCDSQRRRFGGDGYEIVDVRFYLEVAQILQERVVTRLKDALLAAVEYRKASDVYRPLEEGKFVGLLKRDTYEWQREARVVWEFLVPQEQRLTPWAQEDKEAAIASINDYLRRQLTICQPMVLQVPEARKFCRRLQPL